MGQLSWHLALNFQNYIFDMHNNDLFLELQGVGELAEKLVKTGKHETYPLERSFDLSYHYCNSKKKFFSNEIDKE